MESEEGTGPPPSNRDPEIFVSLYSSAVQFLQSYGWFLVLGVAVLFYVRQKFSPTIDKWRRKREEQSNYAFDASVSARRHEAMEASRRRLQEQLDAQAQQYKEQQQKKEEEKRKAKITDWENHQEGKGYKSKVKVQDDDASTSAATSGAKPRKKTTYRDDNYNPLMGGGGGGRSFVPPRRGGMGGG